MKPLESQTEEKTEKAVVPSSDRHNYRITEDTLGVGGAKEKFRNNMAAIQLLHELELEHRLATPEEQEVLARYVGWGGLSMAFDENNAAWAEEFKELNASLSPEEYRAAMESTPRRLSSKPCTNPLTIWDFPVVRFWSRPAEPAISLVCSRIVWQAQRFTV